MRLRFTLETFRDSTTGRLSSAYVEAFGLEVWAERSPGPPPLPHWGVDRQPRGTTLYAGRFAVTFSRPVPVRTAA